MCARGTYISLKRWNYASLYNYVLYLHDAHAGKYA
jgi:hypothetical protein